MTSKSGSERFSSAVGTRKNRAEEGKGRERGDAEFSRVDVGCWLLSQPEGLPDSSYTEVGALAQTSGNRLKRACILEGCQRRCDPLWVDAFATTIRGCRFANPRLLSGKPLACTLDQLVATSFRTLPSGATSCTWRAMRPAACVEQLRQG